jgi:phosphosulfolactate synthase
MGIDAMPAHLSEARAVGFDMIEISDNVVERDASTRDHVISMVRDLGLSPVEEIVEKRDKTEPEAMVAELNAFLAAGADLAMIEGKELMDGDTPDEALIQILKDHGDTSRCMFELATLCVGATTVQIHAGKTGLIKAFGPDVNIGNVTPDTVIETETTRLGSVPAGPFSYRKAPLGHHF